MDILFYNMFYIIKTMKKQTLLYHVRTYDIKKVQILTCPPSTLRPSPVHYLLLRRCITTLKKRYNIVRR